MNDAYVNEKKVLTGIELSIEKFILHVSPHISQQHYRISGTTSDWDHHSHDVFMANHGRSYSILLRGP